MNNRRPPGDRMPNNHGGGGGGGGQRNRRRRRPQSNDNRRERPEPLVEQAKKAPPVLKRYAVVFYDTHNQAREDLTRLAELKQQVDQVNIVVKAEGSMEDPELLSFGKLYAGEAWHLIHKRRETDGWYNDPHE